MEFELRASAVGALAARFERERKDVTDECAARGRNLHTGRTGLEQLPVVSRKRDQVHGCASESGASIRDRKS